MITSALGLAIPTPAQEGKPSVPRRSAAAMSDVIRHDGDLLRG